MKQGIKNGLFRAATRSYHTARQRLIFLDYDGTLVDFCEKPEDAFPDEALLLLLYKLLKECHLVIVSGRKKEDLHRWLGMLPISLVAEHGAWLKEKNKDWEAVGIPHAKWKKKIYSMLSGYVTLHPKTFIEEKDFSLAWHYRKVAGAMGRAPAGRVQQDMEPLIRAFGLQVLEGDKVIEIKDPRIHKGIAVKRWLDQYPADFLMAVGDDTTDEDMFKAMPVHAITVKVGPGSSSAGMKLETPGAVRQLLEQLVHAEPEEW